MSIPKMDLKNVTMIINFDGSSGNAVASILELNKKTKHVQLRFLYIQDAIQPGELTLKKIPTTRNPADVRAKHLPAATIQSHFDQLCLQTTQSDATVNHWNDHNSQCRAVRSRHCQAGRQGRLAIWRPTGLGQYKYGNPTITAATTTTTTTTTATTTQHYFD
eukprot:5628983-Amphidinium_carterae.1